MSKNKARVVRIMFYYYVHKIVFSQYALLLCHSVKRVNRMPVVNYKLLGRFFVSGTVLCLLQTSYLNI